MSLKYHPDKNADEGASAKFQEIQVELVFSAMAHYKQRKFHFSGRVPTKF